MNFDTEFWPDPRIPREMKRCGKPPVRKALSKSKADPEDILRSLPLYAKGKPDYQDFCHLSTYINQERHEVWLDPEQHEEAEPQPTDRQKLTAYLVNNVWRESWGEKPTREEAKARLDGLGQFNNVVRMVK